MFQFVLEYVGPEGKGHAKGDKDPGSVSPQE